MANYRVPDHCQCDTRSDDHDAGCCQVRPDFYVERDGKLRLWVCLDCKFDTDRVLYRCGSSAAA
jgi:hypothetical protein